MPARTCSATLRAIKLHQQGLSRYAAARKAGIQPSTLYRALAKLNAKIGG